MTHQEDVKVIVMKMLRIGVSILVARAMAARESAGRPHKYADMGVYQGLMTQ